MRSRFVSAFSTVVALAGIAGAAHAELVYGLADTATPTLVTFDSASAGSLLSTGSIFGVVAGQTLRAIDFRPSDGQLYALSSAGAAAQLYTINTSTFAATPVGGPLTLTGTTSTRISIDFNPVVDALRVVTGEGQNYRVNATTGALIAQDTPLSISNSFVAGIAYSNNFPGATQTTLYAYSYFNDSLYTIGGINGSPSPNGGQLTSIGPSGVLAFSASIGFDISGASGVAYLSLDDASGSTPTTELYQVNLATGAATLLGGSPIELLDISVRPLLDGPVTPVPEPSMLVMTMAGLGMLGVALRRRRQAARCARTP
ncbi:MAG TPA: DUF4394 domain-containing protein [Caldimonas sp.]|jgi:hypothetical protein|nr:DUF4394 domain-containing protein [Caldimonas sp.]HEX2539706.1 DUF4394 domain-containing protein [Caldimonas sp.]